MMLMFICRPIMNIISYVIHMRTSRSQMGSNLLATDENSLELLPLENSVSPVWKYFGFPSCDERMVESD